MDCRDPGETDCIRRRFTRGTREGIAKKQVDKAETEATTLRRLVEAPEAEPRVRARGGAAEHVVAPFELPAKRQRRLDYDSFD